jgi:hypothetical protein
MTTTATGLDNRLPLPPFIGSGKGEDTLYGALGIACLGDMTAGFLPIALLHDPDEERVYQSLGSPFCISDILEMILGKYPHLHEQSTEEMFSTVGNYLQCWGTLERSTFEECIRAMTKQLVEQKIAKYELWLREYNNAPCNWAVEMRLWMQRLRTWSSDPDLPIPLDLVDGTNSYAERCARFQAFVRTFGQVVQHWPEIVGIVKDLQANGVLLAPRLL